jgi:tetratricopeptide (TPR) repeat protein
MSQRVLLMLAAAVAVVVVGYGSFYFLDEYQPFSTLREDSTVQALRQAIEKNPGDLSSRIRLAALYLDKGEVEAAQAEFQEILKAQPDQTIALTGLGLVYFQQGQRDAALEQFDKVIQILEGQKYAHFTPDLNNAYYYSGLIHLHEGRYQEAESFLRKAVATNSADADAHMYLGWALCQQGRCEEALPELTKATQFVPEEAEPHYYRALVLEKLGNKEEAIQELELALKYRSNYPEATQALNRLREGRP